MEKLFKAKEIAQILGISPAKVYMLVADGELPCVRIGRSVRVPESILVRFIDDRTTT